MANNQKSKNRASIARKYFNQKISGSRHRIKRLLRLLRLFARVMKRVKRETFFVPMFLRSSHHHVRVL